MKVSEPAIADNASSLQSFKNRLISAIDSINDKEILQVCLDSLHENLLPCTFTEEELDGETKQSEASGYITHEEALAKFAKWGFKRQFGVNKATGPKCLPLAH